MEKRYRPLLIDEKTYNALNYLKTQYRKDTGKKLGFSDVLNMIVGAKVRFLRLDANLRAYINAFTGKAASYDGIEGIMLFGSVAKSTYDMYSDIDVFVITRDTVSATYNALSAIIEEVEPIRKKLLVKNGMHLYISPFLVEAERLNDIRTIYFDIVDYGIPLFDKYGTLEAFITKIKSIDYRRSNDPDKEMIEWK